MMTGLDPVQYVGLVLVLATAGCAIAGTMFAIGSVVYPERRGLVTNQPYRRIAKALFVAAVVLVVGVVGATLAHLAVLP